MSIDYTIDIGQGTNFEVRFGGLRKKMNHAAAPPPPAAATITIISHSGNPWGLYTVTFTVSVLFFRPSLTVRANVKVAFADKAGALNEAFGWSLPKSKTTGLPPVCFHI